MKNNLITTFNSIAKDYDNWRKSGQFYNKYERKIILLIFNEIINLMPPNLTILDIGCGTGFWTKEMYNFFKPSFILGIDNAKEMITTARKKHNNVVFDVNDCCNLSGKQYYHREFTLITSALSMDYIGTFEVLSAIKSNLKSDGIGIIWFFDPNRYKGQFNIIKKQWLINNKEIIVYSNRINLTDIPHYCNLLNLYFKIFYLSLPTIKNIKRGIYFLIVSDNILILNQIKNINIEKMDIETEADTKINNIYKALGEW